MSTELIDRLRFLALEDRRKAHRELGRTLPELVGDTLGRAQLVLAGLAATKGRVRKARTIAAESKALIESEAGAVELVGLKLSLLRDTGQLNQALRLARAAASADYQDLDAWRVAHYNLGLIEGSVGNTDRASHSWSEATRCSRVLYRVGAMVNLARDLVGRNELGPARSILEGTEEHQVPKAWSAGRLDTWARLFSAEGNLKEAIETQEKCLLLLEGQSPLRVARHTISLIEYLVCAGEHLRARQAVSSAKVLIFDLEDERQEVAAAAIVDLVKAAAAQKLTSTVITSVGQRLSEASRWDPGNPRPSSKSRRS